jgi:hypothetical protein
MFEKDREDRDRKKIDETSGGTEQGGVNTSSSKHIIATLIAIIVTFVIQYTIVQSLSVFGVLIGKLLLVQQFIIIGIALLIPFLFLIGIKGWVEKKYHTETYITLAVISAALFGISAYVYGIIGIILAVAGIPIMFYFGRKRTWLIYYSILGVACLLTFWYTFNYALGMDVPFTWILNKTGFDQLNLQYLNGWTIWFTFILTGAFIFLDVNNWRLSHKIGKDGKKHTYIHSKVLGILRFAFSQDRVGNNPDFPIIADVTEREEKGDRGYERIHTRPIREYKDKHYNDKVRLRSLEYFIWFCIKILIVIVVASSLANGFATRYVAIQNYINSTGTTWFNLIGKYFEITFMRFSGTVNIPTNFPINEAFTFEFIQFFNSFVYYFCLIWIIRMLLAFAGEVSTIYVTNDHPPHTRSVFNAATDLFTIISLLLIPEILGISTWVFQVGTQLTAWNILLWFFTSTALAILFEFFEHIPAFTNLAQRLFHIITSGTLMKRILNAMALIIIIVAAMFAPIIVRVVTIDFYQSGRQYEYAWVPAYIPTIYFTRWAHEIDNIQRFDESLIAANQTDILKHVRVLTMEASKMNMKQKVGAENWMSINPTDVDIVYINGTEYWAAILTLVKPPYTGDVDAWRSEHLMLTHSEKILTADARSTEIVNFTKIFNVTGTPQMYYGEGGLWKSVDEIYLHIPNYPETHIKDYQGPALYNDRPDYVYSGFWRGWKFYSEGKWDFAAGNYGDIEALTTRDVTERISKIMLPGMTLESDPYPVVDDKGNIYMLYLIWLTWTPPHGYCDWPEYTRNTIIRKFAAATVNMKNGEIDGYFMNTERDDYILSFYRSFYSQWNKQMPDWLNVQMRYPEDFMEEQIETWNWYFQEDFNKWQNNKFYEVTRQEVDGKLVTIEDVRHIMMPINGKLTWCACRLIEHYAGGTRNLAGMYIAPDGEDTKDLMFVDFGERQIIGPAAAVSTIKADSRLNQPRFPENWQEGNILMYSIGNQLYYVVPFYKQEGDVLLPQMIAVVNAFSQQMGYYKLQNPKDPNEIAMASVIALQKMGVTTGFEVTGTVQDKDEYVAGGNQVWILTLNTVERGVINIVANAATTTLTYEMIDKILDTNVGDTLTVTIDENNNVIRVPP